MSVFDRLKPGLLLLVVLIVSALLGYLWGVSSVDIVNTGLWQLEPSYQGIYVQAVADSYALDANDALAAQRLSFLCQQNNGLTNAFDKASERYGSDPTKAANLDQLQTLVDSGQVTQNSDVQVCNTRPNNFPGFVSLLAPVLLVLMALGILALSYLGFLPAAGAASTSTSTATRVSSSTTAGRAKKAPPGTVEVTQPSKPLTKEEAKEKAPSAAAAGAQLSKAAEKTDFEAIGKEPPIVQFMTTYLHGDELYDDSFSIETSSGEFLGETGVGISESLGGSGDGKQVTALEAWLFDKNDIRTVTKVLMSDHAYNDDAIRAKLAPKGEAVLIEPNKKVMLETATLKIQARIVDLSYKQDAMPPKSVIDRVTIELAAWKREGQQAAKPGAPSGGLPGGAGGGGGTPPTGMPPVGGGDS